MIISSISNIYKEIIIVFFWN